MTNVRRKHLPAKLITLLASLWFLSTSGCSMQGGFGAVYEQGLFMALLASFGAGVVASLTPCVYPMIAVTVSVFGAHESRSKLHGFSLSSVFVGGISAVLVPLGLAAALAGKMMGTALSSTWVLVGIALLFVALAAWSFGLFEVVLPSGVANRLGNAGGVGYLGAFILGMVTAVLATPCTGPFLTSILVWIANTRDMVTGAAAMLAFSLGLGTLFWIVGTFALQLPKSGKWMLTVKSVFGLILAAMALYYLKNAAPQVVRLIPAATWVPILGLVMTALGLAIGAVHLGFDEGKARSLRKTAGILLAVVGSVLAITWWEMPKGELSKGSSQGQQEVVWEHDETRALARAKAESKPLMVDFTADWCSACKKLARETFAAPKVSAELQRFVLLKIDATKDDDPAIVDLQKRYGVVGLPTVILHDTQGKEVKRYTDFVSESEMLPALTAVK